MPDIADAHAKLGVVTNYEGTQLPVFRDYDGLDLCAVTVLKPAGVRDLERRIAGYWNAVARYRLRELDFDGFCINGDDLEEARDDLADIPGLADENDPRDLELADWVEVGRRLEAMREFGGHAQLRRLSSLLSCDDPEAWCGCAVSGWNVLPACCKVHGVPCETCGGVAACSDDCGEMAR